MPHRIISYPLAYGGRIFYSTPVLLSAGLIIIVSKDNSSRCCSVRLTGHWHTGTGSQNGKKTRDNGRLWRLSIFVSGWQQGVLYCMYRRAHWHHSSEIPVKSSESHNRTVFGYRGTLHGTSILPT